MLQQVDDNYDENLSQWEDPSESDEESEMENEPSPKFDRNEAVRILRHLDRRMDKMDRRLKWCKVRC